MIIMLGMSAVGVMIAATTKAIRTAYFVFRSKKPADTNPRRLRTKITGGYLKDDGQSKLNSEKEIEVSGRVDHGFQARAFAPVDQKSPVQRERQ